MGQNKSASILQHQLISYVPSFLRNELLFQNQFHQVVSNEPSMMDFSDF